jgi:hypothetical protein
MISIFIVALVVLFTTTSAVSAAAIPEDKVNTSVSIAKVTKSCSAIGDEFGRIISASPTDTLWQNQTDDIFYLNQGMLRVYGPGTEPQMECERCDVVGRGVWDPYWNICYTKWHCCNYCTYHCEDWYELYPCP